MPDPQQKGIFIVFEGIDGAGKSTQVKLLRDALEDAGQAVIASKEPTNGEWGSILRQSAVTGRLSLEEELELFVKDRTEHLTTLILPALKAGKTVILDRYFYSTIAYQGARGSDVKSLTKRMHLLFPRPDIAFILDLDPVSGIDRIAHGRAEQPNYFEDRANLTSARAIFAGIEGEEIQRVDATLPADLLHLQILEVVTSWPSRSAR